MKHVSNKILLRLRWLLIAYSAHFVVGYLFSALVLGDGLHGSEIFNLEVAAVAAAALIYEAIAAVFLYKKSIWMASFGSFAAALLVTTVILEYTGVYLSPYAIAVMGLTFLAAAYSQFAPFAISFIYLIGFLLTLAGVFDNKGGGSLAGSVFMLVNLLMAVIGYLSWRKYYNNSDSEEVAALSRSLHKSQLQAGIVLQAIGDGVALIDDRQIIRLFNPGATAITGWKREEAEGLSWQSVFNFVNEKGEQVGGDESPFNKALTSGTPVHDNKANLLSKSSKTVAVTLSVSPLVDGGKVSGLVVIFRDVSQERAEETQRAEFISTASHEMRTPVAAIEGYLALALNDKVSTIDSRARDYLEKAHASTQHLGKLFQDLLTSAKAEDGRLSSHPVVIEMGAYLQQLSEDLKFAAVKKNLSTEFLIGSSSFIDASSETGKVVKPLYYALADPDRLREVVTNIFDNAVKYTETGKVSIGLTGNDQVVQFYIRDTGPGISAEDIPHLFQKFYRIDNSATRTIGGTGLGLFISRKIVELYRGRIWAESEVGKGTTFFINLPRLTTQQASQLQAREAAQQTLPAITSLANN